MGIPIGLALVLAPLALGTGVPAQGSVAEGVSLSFFAPHQTVWLGRCQVIPFRVDAPFSEDLELASELSEIGVVELVREPALLAGEKIGYLRVRGRRLGQTELSVGAARVRLTVRELPVRVAIDRTTCRITGPAPGAVVWGSFSAGVELTQGEVEGGPLAVSLELSNGSQLAGKRVRGVAGPIERWSFEVDTDLLPPGALVLRAVVELPDGERVESRQVSVKVANPGAGDVFSGECESHVETKRPEVWGTEQPLLGSRPDASGGAFVVNDRPDPTWLLPFEVERSGRYQMMLVARGDFAAGGFPSLGLCLEGPNAPATVARLHDRSWHRIPLGFPVELEAGQRTIGVRFMNENQVSMTSDRNLYLDSLELLRIPGGGEGESSEVAGMMADASMMEASSQGSAGSMSAGNSGGLVVAFERVIDGLPINGRINLKAFCVWPGAQADQPAPAPWVDLRLNGRVVSSQQAAEPVFALDRSAFQPGENHIQLVARLPDGQQAETEIQTVHLRGELDGVRPRAIQRFSVHDERWRWSVAPGEVLSDREEEPGHRVAFLSGEIQGELPLPEELEGDFHLLLETRGPQGQGTADLSVELAADGKREEVEQVGIRGWWNYREAGQIRLEAGPKTLFLGLVGSDGQATVRLRSVILRENLGQRDRTPPSARILYPAQGHEVHEVDAVVVEAWDDDRLQRAELLIDGRPQGVFAKIPEGAGHLVFPLLARGMEPGEHILGVRVRDQLGNLGESTELNFIVSEDPPAQRGRYARAVHLLNRFAYGPEPEQLAAVLLSGEREWLEKLLGPAGPGDAAALDAARVRIRDAGPYFIKRGLLNHINRTDNPVRARFSYWVENHFSTWINKTQGVAEWREHRALSELGPAPFGELLAASATSPAMLFYLDQAQSYAQRLNENYAREIMELHTLGVDGGYDQEDVTTLAGLLSGLTLSEEARPDGRGALQREFRFDPDLGDGMQREVLGMRFEETPSAQRFDRLRLALELLAAHPSTADFVCRKLAGHYVSLPAPDELVEDLAQVFHASGGDMRRVLLELAEHPAFWTDERPRVATPLDYAARIVRCTGAYAADWNMINFLDRSGMGPFDRATPDGYPEEDSAWTDSNAMLQRWNFPQNIHWGVRMLVPDLMRQQVAGDPALWRQRVVDMAAVRLTGWTLGEESNQAALAYLAETEGNAWELVDGTTILVCRLSEASMR